MILEDKLFLLNLARRTIASKLDITWNGYKNAKPVIASADLKQVTGTFVTLTIKGTLRGCMGQIIPEQPIEVTIKENAESAAFYDPRFEPLNKGEFNSIEVEISVLSRPQQLPYKDVEELLSKIEQNVHGLIIRSGNRSATFLPQVWEDIQTKEEFLTHLCMKAYLNAEEWKKGKLDVYTYTVEHFDEKELKLEL